MLVADPAPSPNVKLLNVQSVFPPKFPVPSNKNVPPVKLIVPLPVAYPPKMVMSLVPANVPPRIPKSPESINARLSVILTFVLIPKVAIEPPKALSTIAALLTSLKKTLSVASGATFRFQFAPSDQLLVTPPPSQIKY